MTAPIDEDTICAISTAPGAGGVAMIRVSGTKALAICNRLFVPLTPGKDLLSQKPYTVRFGTIRKDDEILDSVLVTVFHAPHSFTGEDTVEITCHGSVYIQQQLIKLLIDNGCRLARPGEYTERAFLNGKMDLSQAEAVADLIASTSAGQHRLALNQMRGGFSNELKNLREQLLKITSLMELELDFADHEDLEFADRSELKALAAHIEEVISRLARSFSVGNAIKNGIPVAIIGETNTGKSTLLNALLNEDKAIVSEIQGTTRDSIEDTIHISGVLFRFIDTAGIRETHDAIETIGIERTFLKLDQADIVLWMIDAADPSAQIARLSDQVFPHCQGKQLIVVINKIDLVGDSSTELPLPLPDSVRVIRISAKQRQHIEDLQQLLVEAAHLPSLSSNDVIVTNIRHYEALTHALDSIRRVQQGLDTHLSGDFISQDLRECIYYLSDIVGEVTTDQVLGNIFEKFCIGK
jgi:tRNA modification GTPase